MQVNHMNVQRYADMLATVDFHDDLDIVLELHTPEGDINVQAPTLDASYFDPNKQQSGSAARTASLGGGRCSRSRRGKQLSTYDKLQVPLPIPHPASIAVAIYNREHDQEPIDLQDPGCQRVVKATQEVPYLHLTGAHLPHSRQARHHSQSPESETPDTTNPHTPDTPYTPGTPASPGQASTESVTLTSARLAVQEKSFSSEDGLSDRAAAVASVQSSSIGSFLNKEGSSIADDGPGDKGVKGEHTVKHTVKGAQTSDKSMEEEKLGQALREHGEDSEEGAQVLYYEVEKDTSCVLNMSDDGVPHGMPKSQGRRH
ncbi:Gmk_2 protein [Elysia marginata]|uniref:Gmk_2 protein n=1 Tax=Elysia marginata TaxID=1093978 RepID=A0AAV4IYR3_9GAST|nr:Gmk_2 protein [Elysia marginata]